MAHPLVSRRRASALSSALFFVGLAIIALMDSWWPWIMVVIGVPVALRQFLLGHIYDMLLTTAIFIGVIFTSFFDVTWDILLFVIFSLAALFILMREFQLSREHPEDEDDEDQNLEIEEEEAEESKKKK